MHSHNSVYVLCVFETHVWHTYTFMHAYKGHSQQSQLYTPQYNESVVFASVLLLYHNFVYSCYILHGAVSVAV